MRQSNWCEIQTLNDLIGASNILLSVRLHRCFFFFITQKLVSAMAALALVITLLETKVPSCRWAYKNLRNKLVSSLKKFHRCE